MSLRVSPSYRVLIEMAIVMELPACWEITAQEAGCDQLRSRTSPTFLCHRGCRNVNLEPSQWLPAIIFIALTVCRFRLFLGQGYRNRQNENGLDVFTGPNGKIEARVMTTAARDDTYTMLEFNK